MSSPITSVGPVAPIDPASVGALAGLAGRTQQPRNLSDALRVIQALRDDLRAAQTREKDLSHAVRHAYTGLDYVADDPCQPAQRELLHEIRNDLLAVLS